MGKEAGFSVRGYPQKINKRNLSITGVLSPKSAISPTQTNNNNHKLRSAAINAVLSFLPASKPEKPQHNKFYKTERDRNKLNRISRMASINKKRRNVHHSSSKLDKLCLRKKSRESSPDESRLQHLLSASSNHKVEQVNHSGLGEGLATPKISKSKPRDFKR